jgi:ribosomal protein S1
LAWERTENVADVVKMGDVFMVKYLGVDPKTRKEKVSKKAQNNLVNLTVCHLLWQHPLFHNWL